MVKDKLILALDVDGRDEALRVVNQLKGSISIFKVGLQLFTREGPEIIRLVQEAGANVFLDAKYHDIPNTVANAGRMATRLGVYMFNVHAMGGYEMMAMTVEATRKMAEELGVRRPIILGVTILTSIDQKMLGREMGIGRNMEDEIAHLASLAKKAGLDGVVASPKEIGIIRKACGQDFIILTPGIRPDWAGKDDQRRTMTPGEAVQSGANFLVVGRPILQAADPLKAANKILEEMEKAS
ncbi:orotidine-5'-phosphate decarboxylase [bacterium]|nr:orotidine-5'-phosphate decarboxylase [bacterium]